jgi:hypothetical protein
MLRVFAKGNSMPSIATAPRMQLYRQRLRAAGLRPIQLWVPDTKAPGFADECRRQSAALAGDAAEAETARFIEAAGAWNE